MNDQEVVPVAGVGEPASTETWTLSTPDSESDEDRVMATMNVAR